MVPLLRRLREMYARDILQWTQWGHPGVERLTVCRAPLLTPMSNNTVVCGSWSWFQPRPTDSLRLIRRIFLAPWEKPRSLLAAAIQISFTSSQQSVGSLPQHTSCTDEAVGKAPVCKGRLTCVNARVKYNGGAVTLLVVRLGLKKGRVDPWEGRMGNSAPLPSVSEGVLRP